MTRGRFLVGIWIVLTLTLCLGDHFFHLRMGMLAYNWRPLVDGQSVWVWLVFAVAAVIMVGTSVMWPLREVPDSVPWVAIIDAGVLFVGAYALSGQLGASHPSLLFWGFVVAWAARLAVRSARGAMVVHGILFAAIGVVGEGLFSMMGLFDYELQQVVDCPWWLAGLYLHGSIALLEIARGARSLGRR